MSDDPINPPPNATGIGGKPTTNPLTSFLASTTAKEQRKVFMETKLNRWVAPARKRRERLERARNETRDSI